jgi:predicted nucleic acid-binding protein
VWSDVTAWSQDAGRSLKAGDAWIAATALYFGLELLTHDRDFVDLKIPGLAVTCFA